MAWRSNRVNALNFIDVPEDIPVGAVVGRGGCQVKTLQAEHGVRCQANFETRKVQLTGSREGVDSATRAIHELFDQWRVDRDERVRAREAASSDAAKPAIRKVAVVKQRERSAWRFETRHGEHVTADPSTSGFGYRLVETDMLSESEEGEDEPNDGATLPSWISAFDTSFREQMVDDVAALVSENLSPIKIKAAFGLQSFALPDTQLVRGDNLSWQDLQTLQLYAQIKPRWSNMLNRRSDVLVGLLDELETRFDESTTIKTELVVYVNQRHGSNSDVSIKFRWENGEWVVVERDPMRVVYGLYNTALDNETAFRVRVYSRLESPTSLDYEELVRGLDMATISSADPFSTIVMAGRGFPDHLYIRSFVVRETVHVEHRGLRFTISYLNAARSAASLACRLVDGEAVAPAEAMGSLLGTVLSVIKDEE